MQHTIVEIVRKRNVCSRRIFMNIDDNHAHTTK